MIENSSTSTLVPSSRPAIATASTLNAIVTYQLPFGKGRAYMNNGGLVSHVAGGWQGCGIPIGTIMTSSCRVPNAGGCHANYNPNFSGPVRINGNWGSGNLTGTNTATFLDASAFATPANYSFGNTPRVGTYGINNPSNYGVDVNLRREFVLRENLKISLQGDAFNVFNLVTWAAPSTNISSSAFGKISAIDRDSKL